MALLELSGDMDYLKSWENFNKASEAFIKSHERSEFSWLTGMEHYLEEAKAAGYYLLSWMFHYNAIYDSESDFEMYGYHTYGWTVVSTTYQCQDPWGGLICCDWLRLYRHTGDMRWKARFHAAWTEQPALRFRRYSGRTWDTKAIGFTE